MDRPGEWVLLSYRLPREPSTPRIALWRRLKRLGVAQVGVGLVARPADARTREQLEWAADNVLEHRGTASGWLARPSTLVQERSLAQAMAGARAEEYLELAATANAAEAAGDAEQSRQLSGLRRRWRDISRRDFFPPVEKEVAAAALRALTDSSDRGRRAQDPPATNRPGASR